MPIPIPIPMPIPGGGGASPIQLVSIYIAVNIATILCLLIRFLINRKNKRFINQSAFRNLFYYLNDNSIEKQKELLKYDWYKGTDIHPFSIMFISINFIAALILLSSIILNWLS